MANPVTPAVKQFNQSDEDYGLWKGLDCTVNGVQSKTAAQLVMQAFVLNGDSGKAVTTCNAILGIQKSIPVTTKYVLKAGKADGLRIELKVTGTELVARAAAIVAMAATDRPYTIITPGKTKRSGGSGPVDKLSSLIPQAAVTAVPAKK